MGTRAGGREKDGCGYSGFSLSRMPVGIIIACCITIVLITVLLYAPALRNDFVWDDSGYVYENNHIRSLGPQSLRWMFTTFRMSNWHPLTWLSHAVDYAVWGLNPLGHHLISIILHGLNTLLVFLLALQLILVAQSTGLPPSSCSHVFPFASMQPVMAASVTALLFGCHPLHVESVAWVAERKDVLCAFFYLLTLLGYFFLSVAVDKKSRQKWYVFCLGVFVLALMAKPMAVTVPLVWILLDIYPLRRFSPAGNNTPKIASPLAEKIPFLFLSAVTGLITIQAQYVTGAVQNLQRLPFSIRMINGLHAPWFYLSKMFWPTELVPIYPLPEHVLFFDLQYILPGIMVLLITAGCIWMLKRGLFLLFTAWSFYLVTLLPVLGFIQVGSQMAADRYTYIPSIGIFLLAGTGVSRLWTRVSAYRNAAIAGGLMVGAIFVYMCQLTVKQQQVWRNAETLWSYVIRTFPGRIPIAHTNLGLAYDVKGMSDRAMAEYEKAIAINPLLAHPYNNLGFDYYKKDRYDDAIAHYEKALAIDADYAKAYYNLSLAYYGKHMFDESVAAYEKAVGLDPDLAGIYRDLGKALANAYNKRGQALHLKGMFDAAIACYEKALALNPGSAEAYNNAGLAYYAKGMFDQAIARYDKTLAINPNIAGAQINAGLALHAKGMFDEAIARYEKALAINPGITEAYYYMGRAHSERGNDSRAQECFDQASARGFTSDPKTADPLKAGR
jgi:tetratricopeptide (TPR) repeat protein